jgi:hypothetical protein
MAPTIVADPRSQSLPHIYADPHDSMPLQHTITFGRQRSFVNGF